MPLTKRLLRQTDFFEEKLHNLHREVYHFIQKEVEQVCNRFEWRFSTASCIDVTNKHGEEMHDTVLHDLVFWFEDEFGIFGQMMYDGKTKKWLPEDLELSPT